MPETLIPITEDDCRNVEWKLEEITPDYRRWIGHGTHPVTGVAIEVRKTEYLMAEHLFERNKARRDDSDSKRWSHGMGSDKAGNMPLVHVGSIPMNVYFNQLAPYAKDRDHIKWWLNKSENEKYRTRRGKI